MPTRRGYDLCIIKNFTACSRRIVASTPRHRLAAPDSLVDLCTGCALVEAPAKLREAPPLLLPRVRRRPGVSGGRRVGGGRREGHPTGSGRARAAPGAAASGVARPKRRAQPERGTAVCRGGGGRARTQTPAWSRPWPPAVGPPRPAAARRRHAAGHAPTVAPARQGRGGMGRGGIGGGRDGGGGVCGGSGGVGGADGEPW